ncbi:APC family permease [Sinomonas sp. R1AF57]|uniref:APC family permease n=1 Tax=Sinomonas sp. R1AF57 TaxID=2020377 RepID=UPI000B5FF480|nr:APC family permease [Sinomonas sp. R1AF57]ASN51046.1 amino acid permease [Sinomonas sp. R1AF57]
MSGQTSAVRGRLHSRPALLLAFAFAVMADPVSSVAYAIEAALRALNGDLALLAPTMALVVAIIALVILNYRQLVSRYPHGGGASAAVGEAFGDGWSFLPIGALVVDFVLTIAISVSAGASAAIAYFPALAPWRLLLALALVVVVGGLTWFGHLGRLVFAAMTVAFIAVSAVVLGYGLFAQPQAVGTTSPDPGHAPVLAVVLAFPVAMALATGVEAPSSAIAQLGQLDDPQRSRFGTLTLWLTLAIVGTITLGLALEAAHLGVGIPPEESTQIAELARLAAPRPVFAAFQLVTALLLLSAASSSFQAGPGLLKALARHHTAQGHKVGILPGGLGRTNAHHTPYWGLVVFVLLAGAVTAAAGGNDQELVLFYAVSVFLSFLAGLVSMALFSHRDGRRGYFVLNVVGAVVVAFTLVANLARGLPVISLAAAALIGALLYAAWARAGKPRGIRNAAAEAEADEETPAAP